MENFYDVVIIGGGPAGLSAAIYLARAKYKVLVMEKEKFGGQITITSEVVNYPGSKKTSGKELTEQMRIQAMGFGAEFVMAKVDKIKADEDIKVVTTDNGVEYKALGIVLALGASPRKVGFIGEKEFQGRGVAYCATCDGEFFTGKEILVVGGGFAAVEEAMFLTKYGSKVTILVRDDKFSCAASAVDKLKEFPTIDVRFKTELIEVSGENSVMKAKLKNNETGEITEYVSKDGSNIGVFVFAGYEPATSLVKGIVDLDERGYILTDRDQKTNVDGVYAAGDVCVKNLRQVVTAVSDGAVAATSLERHVSNIREKLNIPEFEQNRTEIKDEEETKTEPQDNGAFISDEIKSQLIDIFDKFEKNVTVVAVLGKDEHAEELEGFVSELAGIHDKIYVETERTDNADSYIDLRTEDGISQIRYYSVPGGHEFNSFIIAMYNVAGPGQEIGDDLKQRINNIKDKHVLQVMTTLSCTNCPDVVMATQKIASISDKIEAEMYDLAKYPEIKEKYNIMAVPCLIIDGKPSLFGKHNLEEIVETIENL